MEKNTGYNVQQIEFCHDCDKDLCGTCATEMLEDSNYGELLRRNVQARYKMWWWPDLKRFKEAMGPDVDPVLHGPHQAETVVKPFVEFQNVSDRPHFTYEEANLLYITNLLHDSHEGLTGDVPKPQKTVESDAEELRVNRQVVSELMGWRNGHPLLEGMQAIMGDMAGETRMGRAFEAIERAGYLQTGLRAWSMRNHSQLSRAEKQQTIEMGRIVSQDSAKHLERFASEFPYANHVLQTSAPARAEMLNEPES